MVITPAVYAAVFSGAAGARFGGGRAGGDTAYKSLLAIGLLSPFAFHFARMAGWYSFCFFLVAVVTWAYLRHTLRPSALSAALFLMAGLALVYSNYYGWVVLGFFVIDAYWKRRRTQAWKLVFWSMVAIVIAYTPLWIVFGRKISETAHHGAGALLPKILNTGFSFYTLFISESVAPWVWPLSIPALFFIVASLCLTMVLLSPEHRRFLVYFLLLFFGLAALDMNAKRLLFISAWLCLVLALALSNARSQRNRRLLLICLICLAVIGWGGMVTRNAYAAQHFIEPWADVADRAALAVRDGSLVVSNSPSFLFDINFSLERLRLEPRSAVPGWVQYPQVVPTSHWETAAPANYFVDPPGERDERRLDRCHELRRVVASFALRGDFRAETGSRYRPRPEIPLLQDARRRGVSPGHHAVSVWESVSRTPGGEPRSRRRRVLNGLIRGSGRRRNQACRRGANGLHGLQARFPAGAELRR